jgi:hypothetical protein
MSASARPRRPASLENARHEYEMLEERLWHNLDFRDYLARRRSGFAHEAYDRLTSDADFTRWQALDQVLGAVDAVETPYLC